MNTIATRGTWIVVALGMCSIATGCERRNEPVRAPNTYYPTPGVPTAPVESRGGGPTTPVDGALGSLAQARCEREARCNNVGAGRRHASRDACLAEVRVHHRDDINRADCPAGVDQRELAECLAEIRNDDCNNPLDTLGRLVACRSSDLCRHM